MIRYCIVIYNKREKTIDHVEVLNNYQLMLCTKYECTQFHELNLNYLYACSRLLSILCQTYLHL